MLLARESRFLLRKGRPDRLRTPEAGSRPGERQGRGRIRCPSCGWEPGRHDRWACTCLHLWNTFDTGGLCPACGRQWAQTQCPRCSSWSPHLDWYEDEPSGGAS